MGRPTSSAGIPTGSGRSSRRAATTRRPLASSSFPLDQLHFGDFTGDGITDVLAVEGGRWFLSRSATDHWQTLNRTLSSSLNGVLIADVDGNGIDDVVRFKLTGFTSGRWEVSWDGRTDWQTLKNVTWQSTSPPALHRPAPFRGPLHRPARRRPAVPRRLKTRPALQQGDQHPRRPQPIPLLALSAGNRSQPGSIGCVSLGFYSCPGARTPPSRDGRHVSLVGCLVRCPAGHRSPTCKSTRSGGSVRRPRSSTSPLLQLRLVQ